MPRPSKYPESFRGDAVELVRSSGRSLREVGQELGVNHETLRNWVNAANRADAAGRGRGRAEGELSVDERDELRRLRKKVGVTPAKGTNRTPRVAATGVSVPRPSRA